MRIPYVKKTSEVDHKKKYGSGLHVATMHYGAGLTYGSGLGSMLLGPVGKFLLNRVVIPAGKGAAMGAAGGALTAVGGSYADKLKSASRGATHGAIAGVIHGKGVSSKKTKKKAKRPF